MKSPVTTPGDDRAPALWLLIVWFGLLTGFGEVALLAVSKFYLHRFIFLSRDIVWMASLAVVGFFAIPGIVLFLAGRRWPRLRSLYAATALFTFLGFLSLFFISPQLHPVAALLLAAGLAVQTARLAAARPVGFHRLIRATTSWMVVFGAGLGGGVHGFSPMRRAVIKALVSVGLGGGVQGWGALATRPTQATSRLVPPTSPNVLLIVPDTVRAMNLSVYGYPRPTTPELERFARTGTLFEWAISTAPWTLPSHASMFTGRLPHEMSADWRTPLDATYHTLAEVFTGRGYTTAGFVANTNYVSYESGLDRGFTHYEDYRISLGQIFLSASFGRTISNSRWLRRITDNQELPNRIMAADVNRAFLRWLDRKDQRPFFVFLNYFDAHSPYWPPPPFDRIFGPKRPRDNSHLEHWHWPWTQEEIQVELDAYDGAITYLDYQLGLLFRELEKRGLLKNTLVILASDHGEEFGEHGIMSHGSSLYLPSLHVPLILSFPGRVPEGRRIPEPASLRDLPATIIDLLKLEGERQFPGGTLARFWDNSRQRAASEEDPILSEVSAIPSGAPRWFPISKGAMKSLVVEWAHYIKSGDGREELFDFAVDQTEQRDLARSERGQPMLQRLRPLLERLLVRSHPPD